MGTFSDGRSAPRHLAPGNQPKRTQVQRVLTFLRWVNGKRRQRVGVSILCTLDYSIVQELGTGKPAQNPYELLTHRATGPLPKPAKTPLRRGWCTGYIIKPSCSSLSFSPSRNSLISASPSFITPSISASPSSSPISPLSPPPPLYPAVDMLFFKEQNVSIPHSTPHLGLYCFTPCPGS